MKFRNFGLLLLSFALSLPACVQAQATHEFRLANGMKIIVREDHRAPTVVHMVWYRAGSMDETSATTGVAHVLEHMMFKGTKTLKPGEFSRKVAALGGRENAFTGRDCTAYYQQIDSAKLGQVMALEADRMNNLMLDEKEFAPEIKVIMEERRLRTEDRAAALLEEALHATAFTAHPYRWPIIGWMSDLQQMTAHDAQDWYRRWYAPNNATMVVVGDVTPGQVLSLAEKHYGGIPSKPLPVTRPQTEPEQRGIRRVLVKAPAENPAVILAFKVPALRNIEQDDDAYALDVLEAVLDGYDNARLNAKLVRADKVAHSVNANYDGYARGPALFTLAGTPAKGISTLELENRLRAEIGRIANDGVAPAELERVKTQLVAAQVYKRDSAFGQAMEIGSMEMAGMKHTDIDRIITRLKAVTPPQVQAVARKYFGDDALTIATLAPQPLPPQTLQPATDTRHDAQP